MSTMSSCSIEIIEKPWSRTWQKEQPKLFVSYKQIQYIVDYGVSPRICRIVVLELHFILFYRLVNTFSTNLIGGRRTDRQNNKVYVE